MIILIAILSSISVDYSSIQIFREGVWFYISFFIGSFLCIPSHCCGQRMKILEFHRMMIGFCGNIENIDCKFWEKKFQHEKEKIVTNLYETLINGKALMIHVLNWFLKKLMYIW